MPKFSPCGPVVILTSIGTSRANFRHASVISCRSDSLKNLGAIAANNCVRIWSAMSSALLPWYRSIATPNTTIPAAMSASLRRDGTCRSNQRNHVYWRALGFHGDHLWSGSRHASSKNSTIRNMIRISFPLSRRKRCHVNAFPSAGGGTGCIIVAWTQGDYRTLGNVIDLILLLIGALAFFVVWRYGDGD
jgi:hypothetical protein